MGSRVVVVVVVKESTRDVIYVVYCIRVIDRSYSIQYHKSDPSTSEPSSCTIIKNTQNNAGVAFLSPVYHVKEITGFTLHAFYITVYRHGTLIVQYSNLTLGLKIKELCSVRKIISSS